jgi:hypothetical protein
VNLHTIIALELVALLYVIIRQRHSIYQYVTEMDEPRRNNPWSSPKKIIEVKKQLNQLYVKHTKKPLELIEQSMDRDKFMSPTEAKDFGSTRFSNTRRNSVRSRTTMLRRVISIQ